MKKIFFALVLILTNLFSSAQALDYVEETTYTPTQERIDRFEYSEAKSLAIRDFIDLEERIINDPTILTDKTKYKKEILFIKTKAYLNVGNEQLAEVLKRELDIYEIKKYGKVTKLNPELMRTKNSHFTAIDSNKH